MEIFITFTDIFRLYTLFYECLIFETNKWEKSIMKYLYLFNILHYHYDFLLHINKLAGESSTKFIESYLCKSKILGVSFFYLSGRNAARFKIKF